MPERTERDEEEAVGLREGGAPEEAAPMNAVEPPPHPFVAEPPDPKVLKKDEALQELVRPHTHEELTVIARDAHPSVLIEDNPAMPYVVGTWSGLPNYQCRFCKFSTTRGPVLAVAHYNKEHGAPAGSPLASGLVSPRGEPLSSQKR